MKTIYLIIAKIILISITMICFANVSFAQTKTTNNKQTAVKQDTIIVKSLPWKEEYGADKAEWESWDLETQKGFLKFKKFDPEAIVKAQAQRMKEEADKLEKQLIQQNDTIRKKK